jgi:tRNA nucleotidyltransferase (CCA-adding enzyme)
MSNSKPINLAKRLQEQLPADLIDFIKKAGDIAEKQQQRLYLVGGVVRDLLLERHNLDLDLVVEGEAIRLGEEIAKLYKAEITIHHRFGTAKVRWKGRSADLATARAETYAKPGALPRVKSGTIGNDLTRRDFTVNAMAINLNPSHYGELIDPYGGRQDLKKKLIRVLHDKSFTDDATRIWRALRYEQRLEFQIEPMTLLLIERDIDMLKTISGDRLRHELELVLKEEFPEKALQRAHELGILAILLPSLKADDWLAETFGAARERCLPDMPNTQLYLALLCYRLSTDETDRLISYLRLSRATAKVLRDTLAIKSKMKELATSGLAPSVVYELLHGYSLTSLMANALGAGSETAAEHIELYLNVLRYVNPALTGEDLKKLGVPKGPRIKEFLQRLREARLDGKVTSRKGEEGMVRGWLGK